MPDKSVTPISDTLEREAGHIMVSFALIALGALLWFFHVPKGEDLIPFATGVLARSMIGSKPSPKAPVPPAADVPQQQ